MGFQYKNVTLVPCKEEDNSWSVHFKIPSYPSGIYPVKGYVERKNAIAAAKEVVDRHSWKRVKRYSVYIIYICYSWNLQWDCRVCSPDDGSVMDKAFNLGSPENAIKKAEELINRQDAEDEKLYAAEDKKWASQKRSQKRRKKKTKGKKLIKNKKRK
ncbi:MAG: hypothetical protein ACPGO5_05430 [Patescibacteria group bacterium]